MTRPERKRPGAQSPILTAQVESIQTGTQTEQPAASPTTQRPAAPSTPPGATVDRTFKLDEDTVKRTESAIIRRAGGYTSMRAFIAGAIDRELRRLEVEENNGEPFPRNEGAFQRGRPLGG